MAARCPDPSLVRLEALQRGIKLCSRTAEAIPIQDDRQPDKPGRKPQILPRSRLTVRSMTKQGSNRQMRKWHPCIPESSSQLTIDSSYSHYFETADSTQVSSMFSNIQAGSSGDHGNAFQLKFIISCKETDACTDALAVTDSAPITDTFTPIIRLCPDFFTDIRTTTFLGDRTLKRDPGRRENSWCQPGKPFSFFETGGHTFLHEMTHLDQLGGQFFPLHLSPLSLKLTSFGSSRGRSQRA